MTDRGAGRGSRAIAAGLAGGLVLSLSLTGCDDDNSDPPDSGLPSESETVSETPPTTEPTPTEPAGPTPPELPEAATRNSKAGAKAFVRFYIALENYARHTGEVAPLRQYSHPRCGGCSHFVRYYRDLYDRGGWIRRGVRTIASFQRAVPAADPHDMYVRVSGKTEAGTFRRSRESSVKSGSARNYTLLFWLLYEPDGWRVSRLDTSA